MKKIFSLALVMVMVSTIFSVSMAFAPVASADTLIDEITAEQEAVGTAGFDYDAGTAPELSETVGNIIRIALSFIGVILVVIIVYAGFLWMTAGGDAEQVKKAKAWMTNAIIGLIIILAAYSITDFVISRLFEATS